MNQNTFLMCRPSFYEVFYEINPWMKITNIVKTDLAKEQWEFLYQSLLHLQVKVPLVEPVQGLPDMVFTANAGIVHGNQVLISTFKNKERQPESSYYKSWFQENGFQVVEDTRLSFEGAGDALTFGNYLIAAYGFRTDQNAYEQPFFQSYNLVFCELVDPYFYHLDTCFCPLNNSLALWYPPAFSPKSQNILKKLGNLIAVPETEANHFVCNSIVIDKHILMPAHSPETSKLLKEQGFRVHSCEMSEFIKAGGACKCLVLSLA